MDPNALSARRNESVTAHSAGRTGSGSPAITAGAVGASKRCPVSCNSASGPPLTSTVLLTGSATAAGGGRAATPPAAKISIAGYAGCVACTCADADVPGTGGEPGLYCPALTCGPNDATTWKPELVSAWCTACGGVYPIDPGLRSLRTST